MLRLELCDVSPCDREGSTPAKERWQTLISQSFQYPGVSNWKQLRDTGAIDFGRGFMGFELIREIIQGLTQSRIRFSTLCLGWRGDPLLHPEIEPILQYLFEQQKKGIFRTLRIESTGLFLSESVARFAQIPQSQEWIMNQDGAGSTILAKWQGLYTRIILQQPIHEHTDVAALIMKYPDYIPHVGTFPTDTYKALCLIPSEDMSEKEIQRYAESFNIPVYLPQAGHCLAPQKRLVVSWDGKVTQCAHDIQLRNMLNDDARIVEIWKSRQRFVEEAEEKTVPQRPFCQQCQFFGSCLGPNVNVSSNL